MQEKREQKALPYSQIKIFVEEIIADTERWVHI